MSKIGHQLLHNRDINISPLSVYVHPNVLLTVADSWSRLKFLYLCDNSNSEIKNSTSSDQNEVLAGGILMGRHAGQSIEIITCFEIPLCLLFNINTQSQSNFSSGGLNNTDCDDLNESLALCVEREKQTNKDITIVGMFFCFLEDVKLETILRRSSKSCGPMLKLLMSSDVSLVLTLDGTYKRSQNQPGQIPFKVLYKEIHSCSSNNGETISSDSATTDKMCTELTGTNSIASLSTFNPLPFSILTEEAERIVVDHLTHLSSAGFPTNPTLHQNTSNADSPGGKNAASSVVTRPPSQHLSQVSDCLRNQSEAVQMLLQRMQVLCAYVGYAAGQQEQVGDLVRRPGVDVAVLRDISSVCFHLQRQGPDQTMLGRQAADVSLWTLLAQVTHGAERLHDLMHKQVLASFEQRAQRPPPSSQQQQQQSESCRIGTASAGGPSGSSRAWKAVKCSSAAGSLHCPTAGAGPEISGEIGSQVRGPASSASSTAAATVTMTGPPLMD